MARRIGTKAEIAALEEAAALALTRGRGEQARLLASLCAKLTRPPPSCRGADAGGIERALVETSGGKVVRAMGDNSYWAAQSRALGALSATVEEASLVGKWLADQGWFSGPWTVDQVAKKWVSWLARARACAQEGTHAWERPEQE